MIVIGTCLLLIGVAFGIGVLKSLGLVLLVIGLVLLLVGHAGPVGGRWW